MAIESIRGFVLFPLLAFLITGCGEEQREAQAASGPEWNLVLITVDTYRGDHFLQSRAGEPLTPNLARLASRSITFSNAASAGCETSPGTAAIMTGLLPKRSGVLYNVHMLPDSIPTLASVLEESGFETAAFVGNPVLEPGNGFERAFDSYVCDPVKGRASAGSTGTLTDVAVSWLEEMSDSRFFLWVHYMDPHGPYVPPAEYERLFPKRAFEAAERIPMLPKGDDSGNGGVPFYQQCGMDGEFADGRSLLARYAAEVRVMDEKVGLLLDDLERRGLMERSIVVLTSDHGEALAGDHGFYFSHGHGVTQDQIHVPLLLYYPGCAANRTIDRPVSTMDVFPTVLELLGQDRIPEVDGTNLLDGQDHLVTSQGGGESAIRYDQWKLIRRGEHAVRLLDLSSDPMESVDLAVTRPSISMVLSRKLDHLEMRPPLAPSVNRPDPSEELQRQLEGLGYTGGGEEE